MLFCCAVQWLVRKVKAIEISLNCNILVIASSYTKKLAITKIIAIIIIIRRLSCEDLLERENRPLEAEERRPKSVGTIPGTRCASFCFCSYPCCFLTSFLKWRWNMSKSWCLDVLQLWPLPSTFQHSFVTWQVRHAGVQCSEISMSDIWKPWFTSLQNRSNFKTCCTLTNEDNLNPPG